VILAQYYETGIYLEMDFAKARDLFERGVAVNDVGSMLGLAEMYEAGKGVEKNQFKAFHYILMAASTLNPYGQAVLGSAYEYGKYGIKIDMKQAIRWYDAAAKQGNYLAQDALTRLGVKKKYPS
jgi:TPR repeat protein